VIKSIEYRFVISQVTNLNGNRDWGIFELEAMEPKTFLILIFLITSFNTYSQKVSIGESQVGDSVYLEFDFPREMQIDIYKGNTKLRTIPAFKGVKWFHLEKSTKYFRIIETDFRTLRLIFLTEDTKIPKGKILL